MTTTEIILALAGIAIGAPIGVWLGLLLVDAIQRVCYFIEDRIYDIRRKIRNRGK